VYVTLNGLDLYVENAYAAFCWVWATIPVSR
jgi:hypothetical protein